MKFKTNEAKAFLKLMHLKKHKISPNEIIELFPIGGVYMLQYADLLYQIEVEGFIQNLVFTFEQFLDIYKYFENSEFIELQVDYNSEKDIVSITYNNKTIEVELHTDKLISNLDLDYIISFKLPTELFKSFIKETRTFDFVLDTSRLSQTDYEYIVSVLDNIKCNKVTVDLSSDYMNIYAEKTLLHIAFSKFRILTKKLNVKSIDDVTMSDVISFVEESLRVNDFPPSGFARYVYFKHGYIAETDNIKNGDFIPINLKNLLFIIDNWDDIANFGYPAGTNENSSLEEKIKGYIKTIENDK